MGRDWERKPTVGLLCPIRCRGSIEPCTILVIASHSWAYRSFIQHWDWPWSKLNIALKKKEKNYGLVIKFLDCGLLVYHLSSLLLFVCFIPQHWVHFCVIFQSKESKLCLCCPIHGALINGEQVTFGGCMFILASSSLISSNGTMVVFKSKGVGP